MHKLLQTILLYVLSSSFISYMGDIRIPHNSITKTWREMFDTNFLKYARDITKSFSSDYYTSDREVVVMGGRGAALQDPPSHLTHPKLDDHIHSM